MMTEVLLASSRTLKCSCGEKRITPTSTRVVVLMILNDLGRCLLPSYKMQGFIPHVWLIWKNPSKLHGNRPDLIL